MREWAQKVKQATEGFTAFKFGLAGGAGSRESGPFAETLDGSVFRSVAKGYANLRAAEGDDIDLPMHCTGQFDTRTSIGLCKAIEPVDPLFLMSQTTGPPLFFRPSGDSGARQALQKLSRAES